MLRHVSDRSRSLLASLFGRSVGPKRRRPARSKRGPIGAEQLESRAMLAGVDINGGLSWNGWTSRGLSNQPGLYGSGGMADTELYEVYTTAFAFDATSNTITDNPVQAVAPAPTGFETGRTVPTPFGPLAVSAGAFQAGNTILGIGVRATGTGSITGFKPTLRFDLDNDSYAPASATGGTVGRTSFSSFSERGDFTIQFEGASSWRGSTISVQAGSRTGQAATYTGTNDTVLLPGGVGSGTSYDFAFRAFAQPAAKSYQMFLDMTAIPRLYGAVDPTSVYKLFFPSKAGVAPIGDRVTVGLNGLGSNNVVFDANLNAAPTIVDQTRNVFVGEPDEALVGPRLNATDPDGDTLTWSIVAGSAPADLPFEIDARTGQISVEISAGGLRVLNTEYQQSDIAKTGEYTFDVKVDDGKGHAATAAVTVTLDQVKEMNGVTIRMRGKSLKSTTAVAGYILQGGSDGVGGLVGGLVKEAADELLKNAKGGDVTLLTTGDGSKLWGALWTHSANVTPQVNSVISLEFDYKGGLTAARNAAESPEVTRFVTDADALFFQGGDQEEYLDVWRDTPLQQAVQAKVGFVTIGGTSAGMHIMSSSITANGVGSDAAVETPHGPELEQAFLKIPIFANTVFDTHFWARNRMGRTLAFLARMEFGTGMKGRGIAADESTALIITPEGIARVVAAPATPDANRNIYMFDASIAVYGSTPPLPSVIYTGTIVHKLSVGHQFNIATWQQIAPPPDEKQIERFYLDVDYYQSWFIRRRNWLTGAIDSNRYGDDTPTVPNEKAKR